MTEYNHDIIQVNGRSVRLGAVLDQTTMPFSDFEQDSFSFIREWFGNATSFNFQTSGSTGAPKSVSFSREQLELSARATIQALNLLPGETSLVCLNTKYVAGKMMLVRSFVNRMKIILSDPASSPLQEIDSSTSVDFMALVPLQLQKMMEKGMDERLNKVRNIIIGGAPLNEELRKQINERIRTNVYATYGMTETLSHIALEKIDAKENGIFHTLPGIEIALDEHKCLVIEAPFLEQPVVTNDLGEIISRNRFRWLGRADNMINTGGVKIIPEMLEEKVFRIFTRLNIQHRYFVAGLPDPLLGNRVTLFIEGKGLSAPQEEGLRREMDNNLLKFEMPRQIICIERFASTPTGKINRIDTLKML